MQVNQSLMNLSRIFKVKARFIRRVLINCIVVYRVGSNKEGFSGR